MLLNSATKSSVSGRIRGGREVSSGLGAVKHLGILGKNWSQSRARPARTGVRGRPADAFPDLDSV